ncbi:MAG: UrcA family protein [Sphingomonas sp.]
MTRGMLLVACIAGATLSPAVLAKEWRDGDTRSIAVDASALDLSTRAGMDELSHRIGRAVNRICGSDRVCEDEAWASTEGQVAWVVSHAEWRRRMAEERAAELMSCGGRGCSTRPARYVAPPPRPDCPPGMRGVSVTIVNIAPPPPRYRRY